MPDMDPELIEMFKELGVKYELFDKTKLLKIMPFKIRYKGNEYYFKTPPPANQKINPYNVLEKIFGYCYMNKEMSHPVISEPEDEMPLNAPGKILLWLIDNRCITVSEINRKLEKEP